MTRDILKVSRADFAAYLIRLHLSSYTVKNYQSLFDSLYEWHRKNDMKLSSQSMEYFMKVLQGKNLTTETLNRYLTVAQHIKKIAIIKGEQKTFLVDLMEPFPHSKFKLEYLSVEEVDSLINMSIGSHKHYDEFQDFKLKTLTTFIALTGSSLAEAIQLRLNDLDLVNHSAIVGIGKDKRKLYLGSQLKRSLSRICLDLEEKDLVFTNSKNRMIHLNDFILNLKNRAKKAGITKNVTPRLLKHSLAIHLLNEGANILVLQKIFAQEDFLDVIEAVSKENRIEFKDIVESMRKFPLIT